MRAYRGHGLGVPARSHKKQAPALMAQHILGAGRVRAPFPSAPAYSSVGPFMSRRDARRSARRVGSGSR